MASRTFTTAEFACRADVPDDWHVRTDPFPHLDLPRHVFALSNRPIPVPGAARSGRRRVVDELAADAVLVWVHYRLRGDRDVDVDDPAPAYGDLRPRRGRGTPAVPPVATQLAWRGRDGSDAVTVTALVWEGASVDEADAHRLLDVLSSLTVEFRP